MPTFDKGQLPFFSFSLLLMGASGRHCQLLTKANSHFFLFVLLLMGAGGCHRQVLAKNQAPSFSFFCFVVCRCMWAPLPSFNTIWLPPFFWLLQGAIGHHHQVSTNGELRLSFFSFSFVAFGVSGHHHEVLK